MELLALDEEKLLVWFGCENLEFTKRRLKMVGLFATDEDFRKLVFGLLGKLNTEEYASIYTDVFLTYAQKMMQERLPEINIWRY